MVSELFYSALAARAECRSRGFRTGMATDKEDDFSSVAVESAGVIAPKGDERRRFPRHAITLRVDYKRMNTFFADYAKNISKGGTFIRTSKPLDIGTEFRFVLSIPGQTEQIELRGEVKWTVDEDHATEDQPP